MLSIISDNWRNVVNDVNEVQITSKNIFIIICYSFTMFQEFLVSIVMLLNMFLEAVLGPGESFQSSQFGRQGLRKWGWGMIVTLAGG